MKLTVNRKLNRSVLFPVPNYRKSKRKEKEGNTITGGKALSFGALFYFSFCSVYRICFKCCPDFQFGICFILPHHVVISALTVSF